ncbi:MAG: HIT family protein [Saprospiraceae bacterium]|nr:HIT family protein [Saprospiraceae bacterium]MCF8250333.1 HIT family protein [Saprospiraceae bacterium]MCF8281515.1 HIT family protein [Bacteroidales bacterium]MCF8312141.1 HIT family protein [Saprospiraceae bacterium]MCF8442193.1 HIT family protein [Saprospiraceae bacterium]
MPTIFTRIINGEIPCHKVAESEYFIAFLDINPVAKGHTLIVPKEEVDYLFDLDGGTLAGLMLFAKKVARALDKSIACKRVGVMVIGTEVPHAHVHLIPFQRESQVSVTAPKLKFSNEELAEIAKTVSGNFVD